MLNIKLKFHYEELINNKWELYLPDEIEDRYISYDEYRKITSPETIRFFKCLGAEEKVYKREGLVSKLISVCPSKDVRAIYQFIHPCYKEYIEEQETNYEKNH